MIALEIVLKYELPVRIDLVGLSVSDLCVSQVIGSQWLTNMLKRSQKVSGMRVTVNKHQAHVFDTADRFETMCCRVKIGHDMGLACRFQTAIEVVDPAVIRTDKGALIPRCVFAHLRATMATNVVHGANLTVITTDHDD